MTIDGITMTIDGITAFKFVYGEHLKTRLAWMYLSLDK
jgi:hypothetical protein